VVELAALDALDEPTGAAADALGEGAADADGGGFA
jgi:hypothetical protein